MNNLKFHPISEVFPLMSEAERAELRDDIAAHGLRDAVTLFEGSILDGRNRWLVCQELGIQPDVEQFTGPGSPIDFVASKNLHRRNLTDNQRALAAAKLSNLKRGQQKVAVSNPPIGGSCSQADAAEKFKVSERSVSRAKKVIEDGVPELIERVEEGAISLAAAEQIASQPKTKQMRLLRKGKDKIVSFASRLKVESTLKSARTTHDCCLFCNAEITDINQATFVAFLEGAAAVIKRRRGGADFARYLTDIIFEIEESNMVQDYHKLEDRIFSAIREIPQNESDLIRRTGAGRDELEYAINILRNYGWIEQIPQGGKTEVARGRTKMLWTLTQKGQKEADKLTLIHRMDGPPIPLALAS